MRTSLLATVSVAAVLLMVFGVATLRDAFAGDATYGNPQCSDFRLEELVRFDPPASGTAAGVTIDVDDAGVYFDWASETPIDLVIVKGGPAASLYWYEPPAVSDEGLSAPINDNTGEPYGLSHISFCYDEEKAAPTPPPSDIPTDTPPTETTPTDTPAATPTLTVAPSDTATPTAPPIDTPSPTPTSTASVTPVIPTLVPPVTWEPEPSRSPLVTATASATPTATATPRVLTTTTTERPTDEPVLGLPAAGNGGPPKDCPRLDTTDAVLLALIIAISSTLSGLIVRWAVVNRTRDA